MKTFRGLISGFSAMALVGAAAAAPAAPSLPPAGAGLFHEAAADCHAVGQQIAAQNGGQLARATASSQGGQPVCVIVILVPGKDGSRPRRMEVVVPQG